MKQTVDKSGFQQLKSDLKEGKLGKMYLFYGEEVYLRDHYLKMVKEQIISAGMETFNFHQLDGKEMTPHGLEEAVDCLPMMAEKTLVIVSDWDLFKLNEQNRSELIDIFAQLPDYCTLVFFYDILEYKGDARTKLASALKQYGTLVNFPRQEQGDLVKWVQRRFANMEKDISGNLSMELIFYCGDFMTNLASEIEKIGAYCQKKEITKEDILAVATPHIDAVVFTMTDAMGAKNFDKALSVLAELYQMREEPIRILGAVSRQMRQIYAAKLAISQGKNQQFLAELWAVKPFVAAKMLDCARRFSVEWCRNAVVLCGEADFAMKSSGNDQEELLTQLLLELANGSR